MRFADLIATEVIRFTYSSRIRTRYATAKHNGDKMRSSLPDLGPTREFLPGRENAGTIGKPVVEDVGGQTDDNNEHCDLRGCASRPIGRFSPPPRIRPRAVSEHAGRGLYRRRRLRAKQYTMRAANHLRLTLSVDSDFTIRSFLHHDLDNVAFLVLLK